MGQSARFDVIEDTLQHVIIRDLGPWDIFLTITNDAEQVVQKLASYLGGRRLFYIDSEGEMDELLVEDGKFAGFAPGPRAETFSEE
jgi:hypothetical protein